MLQTVRNFMKHISQTGMVDEDQLEEIYEEHQAIYNSIKEQDARQAEQAMNEHMQKSSKRYNY
jgi:DNA-binding FadR family transcriptional regulator